MPIGSDTIDHRKIAAILNKLHYDKWVSIEMLSTENISHVNNVEQTLAFVTSIYR